MGTGGSLVVIDFSEQGNSAYFRRDGWSGQEPDRVWAIGPHSHLRIPVQPSGRPLMLDVEIDPCREPPTVTGQLVRLAINGAAIGGVRLDRPSMIRCGFEPTFGREGGVLELEFAFPGFFRPDLLAMSGDDRPLAGSFSFIRLYTADMVRPGDPFPTGNPDIPVVGLLPPLADAPDVHATPPSASYTFGQNGTALPFLRGGWGMGEDHFAWIIATSAQIELPAPRLPGPYMLRLDVWTDGDMDRASTREISIVLDRIVIGQFGLDAPTTLTMPLPRELTEGRDSLPLMIVPRRSSAVPPALSIAISQMSVVPAPSIAGRIESLRLDRVQSPPPQAISGEFLTEDAATLPSTIEAALDIDPRTLASRFESLGDDQEFGVVQRDLGLDVLNLFRFADACLPDLIRGLSDDLQALTDPASVTVGLSESEPREYLLTSPVYNLSWHTFRYENEIDPRAVWRDHATQLGFLRRKFYDGLRAGRKIYVVKQPRPISAVQAGALLTELNRHGKATLLCVEPAPPERKPGEVELLMPGLLRGYIGRSAGAVRSADVVAWLRVLANAALLHRQPAAPEPELLEWP